MRKCTSQVFSGSGIVWGSNILISWHDGELAQDCIHKWSGRAFAGAFHELDTFVESGALRNSIEPEERQRRTPMTSSVARA